MIVLLPIIIIINFLVGIAVLMLLFTQTYLPLHSRRRATTKVNLSDRNKHSKSAKHFRIRRFASRNIERRRSSQQRLQAAVGRLRAFHAISANNLEPKEKRDSFSMLDEARRVKENTFKKKERFLQNVVKLKLDGRELAACCYIQNWYRLQILERKRKVKKKFTKKRKKLQDWCEVK